MSRRGPTADHEDRLFDAPRIDGSRDPHHIVPMKPVSLVLLGVLVGCGAARPTSVATAECTATSPLTAVTAVHPLYDRVESENKKVSFVQLVGAEVVLSPDTGKTPQALEHAARCAAPKTDDGHDPLAVPGVVIRARNDALQLTSSDPASAREILARAERLPR